MAGRNLQPAYLLNAESAEPMWNALRNYLDANSTRILDAYSLNAGFEIWTQVDFSVYLNQFLGEFYFSRRANGYQANLFADMILYSQGGYQANGNHKGTPIHIMELKTRSPVQDEGTFVAGIEDDRYKTTQNKTSFRGCRIWSVGINVGTELNNQHFTSSNWQKYSIQVNYRGQQWNLQVYARTFVQG